MIRIVQTIGATASLDLMERTGTTPEGLGATSHYLFIGRIREGRE